MNKKININKKINLERLIKLRIIFNDSEFVRRDKIKKILFN